MTDTATTPTMTTTMPEQATTAPLKRCAIVGTAPTWKQAPWNDQTLDILALNDCYSLGLPRASVWFDLHPFHEMIFVATHAKSVHVKDVPIGAYMRPQGHLDWLKSRPYPVFLQDAPKDWPNAHTFPREAVLERFKPLWPWRVDWKGRVSQGVDYEASTPAWMLMWAICQGYNEIHVYGIHLATEWEYVEQRPNFEFLLGAAAMAGVRVVLPKSTPICRGRFRYAYEPKADLPVQAAHRDIQIVKEEGAQLQHTLKALPWWALGRRQDVRTRLDKLGVLLLDAQQQARKAKIAQYV